MIANLSKPYDWLKEFPLSVFQLDEKPLFGNSPPFPWEEFSKAVTNAFAFKEFKIEPSQMQWKQGHELLGGMGVQSISYSIIFSEMEGSLFWIMPKEQLQSLMSLMLASPVNFFNALDSNFVEGFNYFILSQALKCINEIKYVANLGIFLGENAFLQKKIPSVLIFLLPFKALFLTEDWS